MPENQGHEQPRRSSADEPLRAGERVTDLRDWTHATVTPAGEYTPRHVGLNEPCVSLLYDDGRRHDFVRVWQVTR